VEHDHGGHGGHGELPSREPRESQKRTAALALPTQKGNHEAHDKHAGHSPEMFRDRFWWAALLSIPVVIWSPHVQMLLGYNAPSVPLARFIGPVLGSLIFGFGGWVFLRAASAELTARLPGMMTLISLAITVAFVFSWSVEIGLVRADPLWWELATLVSIMLFGHWIEMRSINQAKGALRELAQLLPDTATRLTASGQEMVQVAELRDGDRVLIRPGERVPADGTLQRGQSAVDESVLTGESRPVKKGPGDQLIAASINGEAALEMLVTGTGDGTKLSAMMRLVAQAQESKSQVQHLADRAARLLTYVAIVSAAITLTVWWLIGAGAEVAIVRAVTVLVIACPHALGLAVPLVVSISTARGARNGLLVRDRRGLEEARRVDRVVFDKTGTLTLGEFRVVQLEAVEGVTHDEALRIAAAVESQSEHPIARGIVRSATDAKLTLPDVVDARAHPGRGISAHVAGTEYWLGGPALLSERGATVPQALAALAQRAAAAGQASIHLLREHEVIAVLAVADAIRPESREAIASLRALGVQMTMLTGDAREVAAAVGKELGIEDVRAQVLPEDKARHVSELQRGGQRVAMVGDGVNDAPALATADVGIAIGAGTDVAVEAGHIVLVRSDPRDIPRIITLSRATYRKMIQNLWWAAGYNIVAIPLAAGVLAPWGIVLSPALGAVLMSASTVVVALNAQLLKRVRL
jgi:Cu2+-exporting ATPase